MPDSIESSELALKLEDDLTKVDSLIARIDELAWLIALGVDSARPGHS